MPTIDTAARFCSRSGLDLLEWPALAATGAVNAYVSTRLGGSSTGPYASLNLGLHVGDYDDAVLENRRRLAAAIGRPLERFVFCRQAHGPAVAIVDESMVGSGALSQATAIGDTDALVTGIEDVVLAVMVADCVPLVLVDPQARVLSCVHAGWGGTTKLVVAAAVEAMQSIGAEPGRIVAGLGPAISAERYQVGDDVADAARDAFGTRTPQVLRPDGTGRWLFDLWRSNRLVLEDAGVPSENIHIARIDSGDPRFFSDRAVRPCGRFAAVAALRSGTTS